MIKKVANLQVPALRGMMPLGMKDPAAEGERAAQRDAAAAQAASRALGKIVIVTAPNKSSTVHNILLEMDIHCLADQFKWGLDPKSVIGMWAPQHFEDARTVACWLIEVRDRKIS